MNPYNDIGYQYSYSGYSDFTPSYGSEYNDPTHNFYPTYGRNSVVQGMLDGADTSDESPFNLKNAWNELTGKNDQARQFATEDYFLDREQEFQREREQVAMEYNSESAQVQRMLEAGLNPNLMFGSNNSKFQGASSPNANGITPGLGVANALNSVVGAVNNSVDTFARARNLASDTALKDIEIEWKPLREDAQLKVVNQNLDNLKKQFELADEELSEMKAHFDQWQLTSPYEYYLVRAQFSNAVKEGELFDEKMKSEQKSRDVMDSTITANEASARQADAAAELYGSEKEKTDVEKDIRQDELNRIKNTVDDLPLSMDMKERITRLLSSSDEKDRSHGLALLKAYNEMNSDIYDASVENSRHNFWKQHSMKMVDAYGESMLRMPDRAASVFKSFF